MSDFRINLMECLSGNIDEQLLTSIKECVRSSLEEAFNQMMKVELTTFVEYELYERNNSDHCHNGYIEKSFSTSLGTINLKIPRDKLNEFSSAMTLNIQGMMNYRRQNTQTFQERFNQ